MNRPEHVIFVFIDGLGLGDASTDNPLAEHTLPAFSRLARGTGWTNEVVPIREDSHVFVPLDATLEVEGLPLSGTGQASLFTGINCAKLAGRHWGPYPHSTSRKVIREQSVFARLGRLGRTSRFVNAFPNRFFEYMRQRDRWTVTTRASLDAGVRLLDGQALRAGEALSADITGRGWPEPIEVERLDPVAAGERLARLASNVSFTLFEHFHVDKAGHAQDAKLAGQLLQDLDGLLAGVVSSINLDRMLLVVTSDHGNVEDLSSRGHTLNPVPLVAFGAGASALRDARDLTDVTPALASLFDR